jgi:hypothetical protein
MVQRYRVQMRYSAPDMDVQKCRGGAEVRISDMEVLRNLLRRGTEVVQRMLQRYR